MDRCRPSYSSNKNQTLRLSHDRKAGPNFSIMQVDLVNGVGSYWVLKSMLGGSLAESRSVCPPGIRDKMHLTDDIWISG